MKKKKPKDRSDPNGWRRCDVVLPPDLIRDLCPTRGSDGNALSMPVARGNAIVNRLAKALSVARELGNAVGVRNARIKDLLRVIDIYETIMTENEIEFKQESEKSETSQRDAHEGGEPKADDSD
jgi:hypothetical protein